MRVAHHAIVGAMDAAQAPLPPYSVELILAGVASVAFLALALATTTRRSSSPLAFDVGLMCVTMSAYNILEVAYSLTSAPQWAYLEYFVASTISIPTLRMFVGYVGQRRRYRNALAMASLYFVGLAVACLMPFARPTWALFPGGDTWAILMLVGIAPSFGGAAVLLYRHAVRSNRDERARVRLLVGALALGVGGVATDLLAIAAGGYIPRLAAGGLVIAVALVAALMLRAKLFETLRIVTLANAALVAAIAILAQIAVVTLLGGSLGLLTVGTTFVVLAVVAAVRPLWITLSEERARMEESATLGRFAQQMAHDVRNPLAAIHGAAQFLLEEQDQGRPLEPHREFIALILDRAERLERVIADYQRMGRVETQLSEEDVNELVREALASHRASGSDLKIELALADESPICSIDRDLFVHALENLVRNAAEAMEGDGTLSAVTERRGRSVLIKISDDGPGMDPRSAERAFDAFYTTKAGGTGLGLAFVARVVEAHGGTARMDSRVGEGTTVELELPLPP